ncbi:MAG: PBS lyase heat protein [uncultured bacterium]|nr:MAG: PBS lyase heat protein [uncultured bacterium]
MYDEENDELNEQEEKKPDGLSAEQILQNLKSKDAKIRLEAITALAQVKNKRVVNLLINCLKDPVWNNRSAAANSLVEIGELSVEPLMSVVYSENEDIRFWSIKILGTLGGAGIPSLAKLLDDPDRDLRLHVVRSLCITPAPGTVEPLITALGDADWSVRKHASEGLEKVGGSAVAKLQKAFQDNLNAMGNDDICFWSIKVLGSILKRDALPAFTSLLRHEDKNIRFYAVGGIGQTRCEEGVDPLIAALSDPSWLVRRQAFEMLELMGEPAVEKLKTAFFQGNDDVKYWAVRLIAKIMKGNAVGILKKMLNTPQKEIRFFIVTALGETDDPRAIPTLIEAFKDNFWQIRSQAAEMVSHMKFRAIPSLTAAISNESEDVRYWSVQALGMIGGEAMSSLLVLLENPDKRMRLFTVKALGNLQNSAIIEPLIKAMGDTSWPVRVAASEILERAGEMAIRPLIKAIGSDNANVSFWSQKVLQNFGDQAVQTLINSLLDKEDKYRMHTIKALGRIGTSNSIKPLLEILSAGVIEECEIILEAMSDLKNPPLIAFLLETLASSEDANIITWVSNILGAVKETGKSVYFKALKNPNTEVRVWACKLLATYEGDDILKALWFAMQDKEPSVRVQAVKSLGEIGQGLNVMPYAMKLIVDGEPMVRFEVFRLLGKIGAPAAVIPMLEAFNKEDEQNQKLILDIFNDIESTNFMMSLVITLEEAEKEMHPLILQLLEKMCNSPLKRDMLIKNMENAGVTTIYWIVQVIGKFDEEQVADALIRLLDHPEAYVHAVTAMARYFSSSNFIIRDKITAALTAAGVKIIKPLIESINKDDEMVKMNAVNIIESIGDDIKPVIEALASDKTVKNHIIALELLNSITRTVRVGGGAKTWASGKQKEAKGGKDAASKIKEELEREMAKTKIK